MSDADEFRPAPGPAKPDNWDDYRHPEEHGHWDIEQIRELLFARDGLLARIAALEAQLAERDAEICRLNMEMSVYKQGYTQKHAELVMATIKAFEELKQKPPPPPPKEAP